MYTLNEKFLDRMEISFHVLKDNFYKLFLPLFVYTYIYAGIIGAGFSYYFFTKFSDIGLDSEINGLNALYSPEIVYVIVVGVFLFLLYSLIYIPVLIGTITGIKQAFNKQEITYKKNMIDAFKKMGSIFSLYWYVFAYVALIPALTFIVGGFMMIAGQQSSGDSPLLSLGLFIMGLALIIFITHGLYRMFRSTLSVYSAVDRNDYSRENFRNTLGLTQSKVLRIFGNLLALGFIVGSLSGVIQGVIPSLGSGIDLSNVSDFKDLDQLKNISYNFSIIGTIIDSFISQFITVLISIYGYVFSYILFKQLEKEGGIIDDSQSTIIQE